MFSEFEGYHGEQQCLDLLGPVVGKRGSHILAPNLQEPVLVALGDRNHMIAPTEVQERCASSPFPQ